MHFLPQKTLLVPFNWRDAQIQGNRMLEMICMPRGLLPRRVYVNLVFYAVARAERECVRADFGWSWVVSRVGRAGVAQLVEHLICNQRVGGSNPFASST